MRRCAYSMAMSVTIWEKAVLVVHHSAIQRAGEGPPQYIAGTTTQLIGTGLVIYVGRQLVETDPEWMIYDHL